MTHTFPKATKSLISGEAGLNLVSMIVNRTLGWIFRRTHQEHDFGIDGYIDIVDSDQNVTGRSLAVQIKHGPSYTSNKNEYGYVYYGDQKHLNYLSNHVLPVLLIICDAESGICTWEHFRPDILEPTEVGWKLSIPFDNNFDPLNKQRIACIAGPVVDYAANLRKYWILNKVVDYKWPIMFLVDRKEVEAGDVSEVVGFFERLRVTKAMARKSQGCVALSFLGYEAEPRELWQVPEVIAWLKKAEPLVKYWFYFLSTEDNGGLRTLLYCNCGARWMHGAPISGQRYQQIELDIDAIEEFLKRHSVWLAQMATDLNLTHQEQHRIRDAVLESLGIEPMLQRFGIKI